MRARVSWDAIPALLPASVGYAAGREHPRPITLSPTGRVDQRTESEERLTLRLIEEAINDLQAQPLARLAPKHRHPTATAVAIAGAAAGLEVPVDPLPTRKSVRKRVSRWTDT